MLGRHKVISVTATPQTLAAALGLSNGPPNATYCIYFSIQALAANQGIVWIGASADTLAAATNYGYRIEIPVSTVPSAPFFRDSRSISGVMDLATWQFVGTAGDSIAVAWETL